MSLDLQERRKGIGGSDIAGILLKKDGMPISPWMTPLKLYYSIQKGVRQRDNASMQLGREKEQSILDEYEASHNVSLMRNQQLVDKTCDIFRCNVDGMKEEVKLLVEAKTAHLRRGWGEDGSNKMPLYYMTQGLWCGAILDAKTIDFAVKFRDEEEIKYYKCARNPKVEKIMRDKALAWWEEHIVKDKPPTPITQGDYEDFVDTQYIDAPENILQLYSEYEGLKSQLDASQKIVDQGEALKKSIRDWVKKNCQGKTKILLPDGQQMCQQFFTARSTWNIEAMQEDGIDVKQYKKTCKTKTVRLGGYQERKAS